MSLDRLVYGTNRASNLILITQLQTTAEVGKWCVAKF